MITRFTLQFEGCYTLSDKDIDRIVDKLDQSFSGGTFRVDAQSVKRESCWCGRD